MKRLIQHIRARLRPTKPVPPVTVPAPAGPARIATPAEQRLAEAAIALAGAKQAEKLADREAHHAWQARVRAEGEYRDAEQKVAQS